MKKNIIILVLAIISIVSLTSVSSMSSRASYWMQRCDAAEAVIDRMADDNEDYFLDVIMDGEEYSEWFYLGGNQ